MYKVEPVDPALIAVRATRIREVRDMAGLTRKQVIDMGVPLGSLQNWEDCRQNGLTPNGARRLVEIFRQAGVIVTDAWLMNGDLPGPVRAPKTVRDLEVRTALCSPDIDSLTREMLQRLYLNYGPIVDAIIPNNDLAPLYFEGDCVAGLRYAGDDLLKALDHFCIVQTMQGQIIIGHLSKTKSGEYQLELNRSSRASQVVEVYSAAPIVFYLAHK